MTPKTLRDLKRLNYRNTDPHFAGWQIWRKDNLYALYNEREDQVEITLDIRNLEGTIKEHKKHRKKRP